MKHNNNELILHYFDGEGRAEISRLALRAGKHPFTDNRYSQEEFKKFKADQNSFIWQHGFGSLPMLE